VAASSVLVKKMEEEGADSYSRGGGSGSRQGTSAGANGAARDDGTRSWHAIGEKGGLTGGPAPHSVASELFKRFSVDSNFNRSKLAFRCSKKFK
jgi:hypothetical protein